MNRYYSCIQMRGQKKLEAVRPGFPISKPLQKPAQKKKAASETDAAPPCPAAVDLSAGTGISPGSRSFWGWDGCSLYLPHRHQPLQPNRACAARLEFVGPRLVPAINCELAAASIGPRDAHQSSLLTRVATAKPKVSSIHSSPPGITALSASRCSTRPPGHPHDPSSDPICSRRHAPVRAPAASLASAAGHRAVR